MPTHEVCAKLNIYFNFPFFLTRNGIYLAYSSVSCFNMFSDLSRLVSLFLERQYCSFMVESSGISWGRGRSWGSLFHPNLRYLLGDLSVIRRWSYHILFPCPLLLVFSCFKQLYFFFFIATELFLLPGPQATTPPPWPDLPLPSCVILGKLLTLSGPQFLHL